MVFSSIFIFLKHPFIHLNILSIVILLSVSNNFNIWRFVGLVLLLVFSTSSCIKCLLYEFYVFCDSWPALLWNFIWRNTLNSELKKCSSRKNLHMLLDDGLYVPKMMTIVSCILHAFNVTLTLLPLKSRVYVLAPWLWEGLWLEGKWFYGTSKAQR